MELKVWVDGVVRVVCGLSLSTSCQDVVVALAQAIGQTGRYVLSMTLRGTERRLVADECPLQRLIQLGQLGAEVQFILRRTGPSRTEGPDAQTGEGLFHPLEPDAVKHGRPQKALTFSLGPSTVARRTNRGWSPSPRSSPEPRASPVSFLAVTPCSPSKEEVFKQILQQQRRLQDVELQLQDLEHEAELLERRAAALPCLGRDSAEDLEKLEELLSCNEAELKRHEQWEEQLRTEADREGEMRRRLQQIRSSMDDHKRQLRELHEHSARLERDAQWRGRRRRSQADALQLEHMLTPLKRELRHRQQQGEELEASLTGTERELQAAGARLQVRVELIEDLNKELRQCNLQQFIQQTGGAALVDQTHAVTQAYLSNAGIVE